MSDRIYQVSWTDRFSTTIAPEVAHREFQRIEAREGAVTPHALLDASRPVDAPLHALFEWDNTKAAERWRLNQAQEIISSLRIVVREGEADIPAMAYVEVAAGGDRHRKAFLPMTSVVDDGERRVQFLLGELRNLEGILRRTEAFGEMAPLRDAVQQVRRDLQGQESNHRSMSVAD